MISSVAKMKELEKGDIKIGRKKMMLGVMEILLKKQMTSGLQGAGDSASLDAQALGLIPSTTKQTEGNLILILVGSLFYYNLRLEN
jgi:hypothetical protein